MDLQQSITESTQEIFSSMIMLELTPVEGVVEQGRLLEDNVTGTVGLAGTRKGILAIHFPSTVACNITASFLGMAVDEVGEDVEDAIGEIANMLGGSIKGMLDEGGRDIELSLPSIIKGSQYTFSIKGSTDRFFIPFSCDAGTFYVEFLLERV